MKFSQTNIINGVIQIIIGAIWTINAIGNILNYDKILYLFHLPVEYLYLDTLLGILIITTGLSVISKRLSVKKGYLLTVLLLFLSVIIPLIIS